MTSSEALCSASCNPLTFTVCQSRSYRRPSLRPLSRAFTIFFPLQLFSLELQEEAHMEYVVDVVLVLRVLGSGLGLHLEKPNIRILLFSRAPRLWLQDYDVCSTYVPVIT
jgi:hypothetical protein